MKSDTDVVAPAIGSSGLRFALPWMIGLLGLTMLPTAASLALSFTRWDGLSLRDGIEWVGAQNYRELLGDERSRMALFNSLYYSLIAVPAGIAVSLLIALLLNSRVRGGSLFRTVFLLPYMLGGVATVMIWSWLLNPRFGIANRLIYGAYGIIDPIVRIWSEQGTASWTVPDWFFSAQACKPALIIMHVWLGGGTMLVLLAAVQRVPPELLEAARVDGAGIWHRFRHVTLPHISPVLLFTLVIGVIFELQSFDQAYLLYNRSQKDGLLFYLLHLYRVAFEAPYRVGYASAMAWVLFAVIGLFVFAIFTLSYRFVHYRVNR